MVDLRSLPCELGNPGELPLPVNPIDGGSVDGPGDDGEAIFIYPFPGHPNPTDPGGGTSGTPTPSGITPSGPPSGPGTVPTGGGFGPLGPSTGGPGQRGGLPRIGGPATGGAPTIGGVPTGPFPGGPGPTTSGPGPTTSGPGPTTSGPGPGPSTGGWICIPGSVGGTGGKRRCVQVAGPVAGFTLFGTKAGCEAACSEAVINEVNIDPSLPVKFEDVEGYQFNLNNILISDSPNNFIDTTYYPEEFQVQTTNLVQNTTLPQLLASVIDEKVKMVVDNSTQLISNINEIQNITSINIKGSLVRDIADILYNLTLPDGRQVSESKINKALQTHLIFNTLDQVDTAYIRQLRDRAVVPQERNFVVNTLLKSDYGVSRKELNLVRKLTALSIASTNTQIVPNQSRAVFRALANAKPLDPSKYSDLTKELLKLWYILPTDIYRRINVETSSGEIQPIFITNNETIVVTTSAGASIELPVDPITWELSGTTSALSATYISSDSDIDRAYGLQNRVEQASMFDAGSEWRTFMQVTSPSALNLEFEYSLSAQRQLYYILKLDKSTIADIDDEQSILVRKTYARYNPITNVSEINALVNKRIYPWKVFTINHNDPILGHFSSSSTYDFNFFNFSLDKFGETNGEQIFVRRIPELIIILPTDKQKYNFFNNFSKLLTWNSRQISFEAMPETHFYDVGLDRHWVKIEETYPDLDINGEVNVFGRKGTFDGRAGVLSSGFKDTEILPRQRHGFRAAYEIAKELYNTYKVDGGLSWSDIFLRMTPEEYKSFKMGIPMEYINRLAKGEKLGVKIYHNRGDSYYRDTRLVNLREGKEDTLPVKLIKLSKNESNTQIS